MWSSRLCVIGSAKEMLNKTKNDRNRLILEDQNQNESVMFLKWGVKMKNDEKN